MGTITLLLAVQTAVVPLESQLPFQDASFVARARTARAIQIEALVDSLIFADQHDHARELLDIGLGRFPDHAGLLASRDLLSILSVPEATNPDDSDPRILALEAEIDGLIIQLRFDEAEALLRRALDRYPAYEGFRASMDILSFVKVVWRIARTAGFWLIGVLSLLAATIILTGFRWPIIAARAYVIGVYTMTVPFALAALFILFPIISTLSETSASPVESSIAQASLVIVTCILGALGGNITASFALSSGEIQRVPKSEQFGYIAFKPLNGFFLAAVMYIALMSGQLALFDSDGASPSPWIVALLAVLTGLFSDAALVRLRALGASIFGRDDRVSEREVARLRVEHQVLRSDAELEVSGRQLTNAPADVAGVLAKADERPG